MKYILRVWLLLMPLTSVAQSSLPPCTADAVGPAKPSPAYWNNCRGTFTLANGDNFVGEFKDGKRNGQGTYTYANGNKFVGEYKDDKANGQGTFTFANGNKYVGEFKDGKRNGEGIEYTASGSIIKQGRWVNGTLINSYALEKSRFPFTAKVDPLKVERDRLAAEAEEARKRQQELEERLAQERAKKERLAAQFAKQNQPAPGPNAAPVAIRPNDKRIALVIGNGAYKVRPLNNPVNDANDISAALKRSGFQVIDVRNANLTQMRAKIREFGDQLINSDVGLVYYSGHGVELKGRNYLIPVNADIQREDEIADQGLDAGLILEKMNTAGKGVNILVVDACRDDPFGRSFRSTGRGLAQMDAPKGTIIAYSTSPGKVASDGDPKDRNSPYTKHLLRAMQIPNIPIEQVFKEVRRSVQAETKNQQTPWENTSLSGDFYFSVKK